MTTTRLPQPLRPGRRVGLTVLAFVLLPLTTQLASRAATDDDKDDLRRLVRGLELRAGMTAAEIGAGNGSLTLAVAREIGPAGRMFTTELGDSHLRTLREAIEKARAGNVTVVEAAADGTSLPEACCDVIFMRDVYHHFNDPAAINDSLRRSLKPCGRLAILDFRPSGTESSTPAGRSGTTHGVAMRTASDELGRAGLEILQEDAFSGRNFLILARRPGSDGDPARTCPGPSPK